MRLSFAALALAATFAASGCQMLAGAGIPIDRLDGSASAQPSPGVAIGGTSGGDVAGAVGEPDAGSSLPPDESDGAPKPVATYHSGGATLELSDGTQLILDRIDPGPHLYAQFGSLVRWSNDSGWYLTLAGAGAEADMGPAYLTLDRVTGTEHWTANDPTACKVRIASATPAALSGTAQCRGVQWLDALDTRINGDHPRVADQPPFSANVTFAAAP